MNKQQTIRADRARAKARQKVERDVVYTQPKPFNRNRFLLQLAIVAAVVLALLFGMTIFFKVKNVEISGATKYDAYKIREESGIIDGENLLTLNKKRVSARVLKEFPYIDKVQVGIRLPDTVVIQITELEVVYAVQDYKDGWWLMNASGKIVDTCTAAAAEDYTRIVGVKLSDPKLGSQGAAYEPPREPDEAGNTTPPTVYAQEKLDLAVDILQQLENVHFIGSISTVDVTSTEDIQLWYGTRFQMLLGNSQDLAKKIGSLAEVINHDVKDYDSGILDASFTVTPDQVGADFGEKNQKN